MQMDLLKQDQTMTKVISIMKQYNITQENIENLNLTPVSENVDMSLTNNTEEDVTNTEETSSTSTKRTMKTAQ